MSNSFGDSKINSLHRWEDRQREHEIEVVPKKFFFDPPYNIVGETQEGNIVNVGFSPVIIKTISVIGSAKILNYEAESIVLNPTESYTFQVQVTGDSFGGVIVTPDSLNVSSILIPLVPNPKPEYTLEINRTVLSFNKFERDGVICQNPDIYYGSNFKEAGSFFEIKKSDTTAYIKNVAKLNEESNFWFGIVYVVDSLGNILDEPQQPPSYDIDLQNNTDSVFSYELYTRNQVRQQFPEIYWNPSIVKGCCVLILNTSGLKEITQKNSVVKITPNKPKTLPLSVPIQLRPVAEIMDWNIDYESISSTWDPEFRGKAYLNDQEIPISDTFRFAKGQSTVVFKEDFQEIPTNYNQTKRFRFKYEFIDSFGRIVDTYPAVNLPYIEEELLVEYADIRITHSTFGTSDSQFNMKIGGIKQSFWRTEQHKLAGDSPDFVIITKLYRVVYETDLFQKSYLNYFEYDSYTKEGIDTYHAQNEITLHVPPNCKKIYIDGYPLRSRGTGTQRDNRNNLIVNIDGQSSTTDVVERVVLTEAQFKNAASIKVRLEDASSEVSVVYGDYFNTVSLYTLVVLYWKEFLYDSGY